MGTVYEVTTDDGNTYEVTTEDAPEQKGPSVTDKLKSDAPYLAGSALQAIPGPIGQGVGVLGSILENPEGFAKSGLPGIKFAEGSNLTSMIASLLGMKDVSNYETTGITRAKTPAGQVAQTGLDLLAPFVSAKLNKFDPIEGFLNREPNLSNSQKTGAAITDIQNSHAEKNIARQLEAADLSGRKSKAMEALKKESEMFSSKVDEDVVAGAKAANEKSGEAWGRLNDKFGEEFNAALKGKTVPVGKINEALDKIIYEAHGEGGLHASNYGNMTEGEKALFEMSQKFKKLAAGQTDAAGELIPGSSAGDSPYPIDQLDKDLKRLKNIFGNKDHAVNDIKFVLSDLISEEAPDLKLVRAKYRQAYQDKARFNAIFQPGNKQGKIDTAVGFLKRYVNGTLNSDQMEFMNRITNDPNSHFRIDDDTLKAALSNKDIAEALESKASSIKQGFDMRERNLTLDALMEKSRVNKAVTKLQKLQEIQKIKEGRIGALKKVGAGVAGAALLGGAFKQGERISGLFND